MNAKTEYREALARRAELTCHGQESAWLAELPLKEMVRFGWVHDCRDSAAAQVAECLRFFGVATVPAWHERYVAPLAAFRAPQRYTMQPGAVAAWLRQGERRAAASNVHHLIAGLFRQALQELRALTNEPEPDIFAPKMTAVCAAAGVAVMLEPAPSAARERRRALVDAGARTPDVELALQIQRPALVFVLP